MSAYILYFHFSLDLDLRIYLDTEIWKASVMINPEPSTMIKPGKPVDQPEWEKFGINWQ